MRTLVPLLVLGLAPGSFAQVPFGYLVTAESGSASASAGLRFIEPATGVATDVRPQPGARLVLPRAQTVTIDPGAPDSVPFVTGLSTSVAPSFQRAGLRGNVHLTTTNCLMVGVPGVANRLEAAPTGLLATVSGGTQPGLWQVPPFGGTAVQLVPLAGAFDVAVAGQLAYVSSYRSGMPSQIDEVDLNTGAVRTVGLGYPPLRALLAIPSVGLIAGTDNGDLLNIDPAFGTILQIRNLFPVAIVALAGDASVTYALTDRRGLQRRCTDPPGLPRHQPGERHRVQHGRPVVVPHVR
ncbi:MAG TPA: hypothetical protein VK081_13520 [Planctomycetota bacterium]|nr:hypothetical protein [Planctomycetota bacterium]